MQSARQHAIQFVALAVRPQSILTPTQSRYRIILNSPLSGRPGA